MVPCKNEGFGCKDVGAAGETIDPDSCTLSLREVRRRFDVESTFQDQRKDVRMNALTTAPEYRQAPAMLKEKTAEEGAAPASRHLNGYLLIVSLAAVLAIATAAECGSVMHPASLVYGAVLWGWWGTIACVLWKLAPRLPISTAPCFLKISRNASSRPSSATTVTRVPPRFSPSA